MTDSVVESVVTFALENLLRLLADEINLHSDIKANIKSLRRELEFMDVFLKSSEGKRNNDTVKLVVNQIRDVAFEAEDVVDTYITNVTLQRRRNILDKLLHCISQEVVLHDRDSEIDNIKRSIDEIYKNRDKYKIGEGEFQSERDTQEQVAKSLNKRRRNVEEEDVVGLVHDSDIVIKKLVEGDSRLSVVSIIGMGGLGKTTLAKKIYNKEEVKSMFNRCAWGYVSNDYRVREILLDLLKCLESTKFEYNDLSEEKLKGKVRECLNEKMYLVVLDDIWKTEVWDELKDAFPDNRNGSRILITSRMKDVASYSRATLSYNLPFLNNEDSWELFSKKVFGGEKCPELEDLGRTMAESCKGLPLAIIVLAGMVAKKEKSQREWSKVKNHVNWHENNNMVMDILRLSYNDLPQRLKPCFLYLGIYPEDYEIHVRELIRLWIAEGFIQPPGAGTSSAPPEVEDIGDCYLDELVDRSLVQVASRRSDGGVKTCRVHDLLRDLCISESKTNKFMEVCREVDLDKCNPRRLSLNYNTKELFLPATHNQYCSRSRSLFIFSEELKVKTGNEYTRNYEWIAKSFKLARVLHLCPRNLYLSHSDLKLMIHLRYLRLEYFGPTTVPDRKLSASICSLWNLETLHLNYGGDVPSGIWKLKRLRHVFVRNGCLTPPPASAGSKSETMWNLQTLTIALLDEGLLSLLNNDCFPNLRNLGLTDMGEGFGYSPEQFRFLHRLIKLCTLKLRGRLFLELVGASAFPPNLTKLTVTNYFGSKVDIGRNTLVGLTNLQTLKLNLCDVEYGGSLDFVAGQFPQLELLEMSNVRLERLNIEKGAMPRLRYLKIIECNELIEISQQVLWSIPTLQEVHVVRPTTELRRSLQNVEPSNGCKIIIEARLTELVHSLC